MPHKSENENVNILLFMEVLGISKGMKWKAVLKECGKTMCDGETLKLDGIKRRQ